MMKSTVGLGLTALIRGLLLCVCLAGTTLQAGAQDLTCLQVDLIETQTVMTNQLVAFTLRSAGKGGQPTQIFMQLGGRCPQLAFHKYFHFVPVAGALCAGRDTIQARSGESCDIIAFSTRPVIVQPDRRTPQPVETDQGGTSTR